MKFTAAILISILAGIGIGWFAGYSRVDAECHRKLVEEVRPMIGQFEVWNQERAAYAKKAEPWMASSASIALGALKHLKTNDTVGAKYRLASIVAVYYRAHSHDGDTNLLDGIVKFAATDSAFSNAFYGPLKAVR
jgi:hypothetical protein